MRRFTLLLAAIVIMSLAQVGVAEAAPLEKYYALGDSYSSGEGVDEYEGTKGFEPETDLPNIYIPTGRPINMCHRSVAGAYPLIYAKLAKLPADRPTAFRACSGAVIDNLTSAQYPFNGDTDGGQLSAVMPDAELITITIGGNDAKFEDILTNCITLSTPCNEYYGAGGEGPDEAELIRSLRKPLQDAYQKILLKAPGARLVVLTYPQIFAPRSCFGTRFGLGVIDEVEQQWLRDMTALLNEQIRVAAPAAGAEVLDIKDLYEGKEVCVSDEFVWGLRGKVEPFSFHPKGPGQKLIADKLFCHVQRVTCRVETPDPGSPASPPPGPAPTPTPTPKADLEVVKLQPFVREVCVGSGLDLTALVRNNGNAVSGTYDTRWTVEGKTFDGIRPSLAAGAFDTDGGIAFNNWTPLKPGTYVHTLTVDPAGKLVESDESNNVGSLTIVAVDCAAAQPANLDLVIERVWTARNGDQNRFNCGDDVRLALQLRNPNAMPVAHEISFLAAGPSGRLHYEERRITAPPGSSQHDAVFVIPATTRGQFTYTADVFAEDGRGSSDAEVGFTVDCASPQAPTIVQTSTYREGVLVYFSLSFADGTATGFGFRGVNGAGWAEESHAFTSPSYGRVSPGRLDYPFNHACGTPQQYESDVQAWIYDSAGRRSAPVTVHLKCS